MPKTHSEETKRKISIAHKRRIFETGILPKNIFQKNHQINKGKNNLLGKTWVLSESAKENIRKGRFKWLQSNPHSSLGKHWKLSEETKKRQSEKIVSDITRKKLRNLRIENPNRVFKDTSIEIKIEKELIRRNVKFQKQVPLEKVAIVDFFIPEKNIIIQADGDYWHRKPNVKERDKRQDIALCGNGYKVYRFWEKDINNSVEKCLNSVDFK